MKVRLGLWIALALTLVLAGAAAFVWLRPKPATVAAPSTSSSQEPRTAARARELRTTAVVEVAPAPMPTKLPLLGADTVDQYGSPTSYVDRAALRSLLWHRAYDDLNRYFTDYQEAFEKDPKRELWPIDARDAFESAEPQLRAALDGWVKATPKHFAPYLARGGYYIALAWARRGHKFADETPTEDLDAMKKALPLALADFRKARELRPKLLAAVKGEMEINGLMEKHPKSNEELLREGLDIYPDTVSLRLLYLRRLTPRWGGTYEAMDAFTAKLPVERAPKLKELEAVADVDRADGAIREKNLEEAERLLNRAEKKASFFDIYQTRSKLHRAQKNWDKALADLDKAAELRPGLPDWDCQRANVLQGLDRWQDAGTALLRCLRGEPTNELGRAIHANVVQGLKVAGWNAQQAHEKETALAAFDLAADLAPFDGEVHNRRAWVILGGQPSIAALEALYKEHPDDLRVVQSLDYALSQERKFDRILELWNTYLEKHPDEGRAYLERAGTEFHLGKGKESQADATRACELGLTEGCMRAKQLADK